VKDNIQTDLNAISKISMASRETTQDKAGEKTQEENFKKKWNWKLSKRKRNLKIAVTLYP